MIQSPTVMDVPAKAVEAVSVAKPAAKAERFPWLFYVKGIAFLFVFVDHVAERLFGSSYFATMTYNWPPLADRINQLQPIGGYGILGVPVNALRYVGWNGAQSVQLFLIVSGFGLAWGLLNKYGMGPISIKEFYSRRAWRLYPMWWAAHILFVLTYLLIGWGMDPTDRLVYISMLGIRVTTDLLYHFTTAWWYFGVMIQLYLAFPILWAGLRRLGPVGMLVVSCTVTFIARAVGMMFMTDYLDAWLRGAIFITQIAAFAFGLSLAVWMRQSIKTTDERLRSPSIILLALGMYLLGTVGNFTEIGMVFAPFLRGVGLFILIYAVLARFVTPQTRGSSKLTWLGKHSYSLFLMHQPFIALLLPSALQPDNVGRAVIGIIVAFICAIFGAIFLEWVVAQVTKILSRWRANVGWARTGLRTAFVCLLVAGLVFGAEFTISRAAPQAVLGWGEKSSLQLDSTLGWKMKPSTQTHLRFDSYDYTVTSNSLGFPGPDYAPQKTADTFRIMVVGDSYTSANGVDTNLAWPRLLETELSGQLKGRNVQVMNFAVTGYDSDQYSSLIDQYASVYKPDLIVVAYSSSEFLKVLRSPDAIQDSIGLDYPPADSGYAIARLENWDKFVSTQINGPLEEILNGTPNPTGYELGKYAALEINNPNLDKEQAQVALRLGEMKSNADKIGARLDVLVIPGPAQVCTHDQLGYLPRTVNLNDTTTFDKDLPQRLIGNLAKPLGLPFYDLRTVLGSVNGSCLYQPNNTHLLPSGHRAIADYLTQEIVQNGF